MGLLKPEFKQQGAGFEVVLYRNTSENHPTTQVPSDTQVTYDKSGNGGVNEINVLDIVQDNVMTRHGLECKKSIKQTNVVIDVPFAKWLKPALRCDTIQRV